MTEPFHQELETASRAVQICADLTKRLQRQTVKKESQVQKSDFSPVTIGDFAVQALLTCAIHRAFPTDSFLAEESADELRRNEPLLRQVWQLVESVRPAFVKHGLATPGAQADLLDLIDLGGRNDRSDHGRVWVFDPIDGTATFLRGQQYAINCAFLVDGREQVGIIGCPNVSPSATTINEEKIDADGPGLMIFAARGQGTWLRPLVDGGSGELAEVRRIERHGDHATLERLVWTDCATYTSTILMLHQQVVEKLNTEWPGVDLFSSLMKYAALGLGHASVCIRIFKYASWRSNMWDHAGGVLIFEEAGGRVTDLDGKSIDFSKGRKMADNFGLVCAPSSVHAEVLRIVQDVMKAYGPIPWSK